MTRLRQIQRDEAVTMLLRGDSQSAVAMHLGVHRSTISSLYERLRTTGSTKDCPRTGRHRVTSRQHVRYTRLTHLRDRILVPAVTAANTRGIHNARISVQTVKNRLRETGLRARRPYVGLLLTARRRDARIAC